MAEDEEEVGRVMDYFAKISVAGIDLAAKLRVGDTIRIKGHTTDLEQVVESMQIDRDSVEEAGAGDKIGVKVKDRCRGGDHGPRGALLPPPLGGAGHDRIAAEEAGEAEGDGGYHQRPQEGGGEAVHVELDPPPVAGPVREGEDEGVDDEDE